MALMEAFHVANEQKFRIYSQGLAFFGVGGVNYTDFSAVSS